MAAVDRGIFGAYLYWLAWVEVARNATNAQEVGLRS